MNNNSDQRPNPDALLAEAKREGRGTLKIFLGAAPGVGKTFSMLRAAQARKKDGADIVVGIVETHQRSETNAMLEGLESIPRLNLEYRGTTFQEMDIDAILKRNPKWVLVDELAHSNIPGARHPKRYQDVLELLDHGINVYTTVNVQHIESLNDIVTRITGVTVRETLPDSIMQMADEVELIDLTPDELLRRLKDGKVYIPEQARLAMNRFFTPGNLTALRELALRQAAARVDEQMTSYMRSHAIEGPWPTSDRVLVSLSDDGQAIALVRTAKRSAERRRAHWIALYVETHRHSLLPEAARRDIAQALHMAENLGGEVVTVASEDVAGEVLRIARERNVSSIIIGKSRRTWLSHLSRPSVCNAILQRGYNFDITVMNVNDTGVVPLKMRLPVWLSWAGDTSWLVYARAFLSVGITTGVAALINGFSDLSALSLIYLINVLLIASDYGFKVSAFTTFVGFLAADFFFTKPTFSLYIDNRHDFFTLSFYVVAGLAIGMIGDRLQRQIGVTRHNAERTQALYDFNRALAGITTLQDIQAAVVQHVGQSLKARTVLLLEHDDRLVQAASFPENIHLDTASAAAMNWAWQHGRSAGLNSDTLPGAAFYGVPLRMAEEIIGVLAIRPEDQKPLSPDQELFFASLATQSAMAVGRARLITDIQQARVQTETERLRSNLLSSISHDLRTPLVAVLGTTTTLRDYWGKLDEKSRLDMFGTIEEEAERLNRFVQNLLDMSALVTGGLSLRREAVGVEDLVGSSLSKLRKQLGDRPLRIDVPAGLPDINGDFAILERVLINVIDNACKYAAHDQPLTVAARREQHYIRLTVTDRGPGIPENERERVFDMFYRVKVGSAPTSGAGLGLAICRGFIEAHGGKISTLPGSDGVGTQIMLRLPLMESAPQSSSALLPDENIAPPTN